MSQKQEIQTCYYPIKTRKTDSDDFGNKKISKVFNRDSCAIDDDFTI
jgi:hypothetical protein